MPKLDFQAKIIPPLYFNKLRTVVIVMLLFHVPNKMIIVEVLWFLGITLPKGNSDISCYVQPPTELAIKD